MRIGITLLVTFICLSALGCERMRTETGGGTKAKNQPEYSENEVKIHPNQSGATE